MLKLFVVAGLVITPTSDQISACMPDVIKYCGQFLSDHKTVMACMLQHRRQLSQTCRNAFHDD